MHSYLFRLNGVITFSIIVLAAMCIATTMTDFLHQSSPQVHLKVLRYEGLRRQLSGNDEDCSSGACERNWSAHALVHTKRRNRLSTSQIERLIYCRENMRIMHKFENLTGPMQARLRLNITADLSSLFSWNTKQLFVFVAAEFETQKNSLNQISLWDKIITSKEESKFQHLDYNKYSFVDQGNNLRGLEFNLTMHWYVMPITGRMFMDKISIPGFRLPTGYH